MNQLNNDLTPDQEAAEALGQLRTKYIEWLDEKAAWIEENRARGRDVHHIEDLWLMALDVYSKLGNSEMGLKPTR
jgi:hypothetical protein